MSKITYEEEALQYISKLSSGGMRDAISLLDKCLAYSNILTLENVVKALGTVEYDIMIELTNNIINKSKVSVIELIENIHDKGKDLKLFVKSYIQFLLDARKWSLGCSWDYLQLPELPEYTKWLESISDWDIIINLFEALIKLQSEIKYSSSPKYDVEACLLLVMED